ncbi:hypothetical protein FQN54_003514 [Arachnomyces sp. PD_36]|nr:hypothetical protein FQN54_003514 [Arachnomyces sp. PD_36]
MTNPILYDLSLNLYSLQNGHWSLMIYPSRTNYGRVFHVRNTDDFDSDKFFYEERDQGVESGTCVDRSVLTTLSEEQRTHAMQVLRDYASRDENIPRFSQGRNCQTFVVECLRRLEEEGLVSGGNADFFELQCRRAGSEIISSLQAAGRSWVQSPPREMIENPDARFHDKEPLRPVGKLRIEDFEGILTNRRR